MNDSENRIANNFKEFQDSLRECENSNDSRKFKDAYNSLSRLRDRYNHENDKKGLDGSPFKILENSFNEDVYIRGMMTLRQIAEHVQIKEPVIYTSNNSPIYLDASCSAGSVFEGGYAIVTDTEGNSHRLDHLERLNDANQRINSKWSKIKLYEE